MIKLVLVRHGQSMWNLENKFTGWTDVELSEQGIQEAKEAGKILKEKGFHFDLAFLGVVGIDLESKSVMTYMPNDGQTKRIVLKQSKKAYMLADSDKFYQMGNYEYAKVDAFYGILQTIKNNKK